MSAVQLRTGLSANNKRLFHDLCFVIAFNQDEAPNKFIARLHDRLLSNASAADMAEAVEWIRDGRALNLVKLGDTNKHSVAVLIRAMWVQDRLKKNGIEL